MTIIRGQGCSLWLLAVLLCVIGGISGEEGRKKGAYATLLYSEDFLLGVRVLGESIRKTETDYDLVVIVTEFLPKTTLRTLEKDGWNVKVVKAIDNPGNGPQEGRGYPSQFRYVYTKLFLFGMTEYEKVVFLDADTLVLRNSDELFTCPGFCAVMRHSERFNTGVMVITPSEALHKDIMSKIHSVDSYTGGDQGFLNVYFRDLIEAPVFEVGDIPADAKMMRLPTAYNADIGLYVANSNRWMIPRETIRIVHYTLGPIKPWNWWTSWVITDLKDWQNARRHLGKDDKGNRYGMTSVQRVWIHFLSWLPLAIAGVMYTRMTTVSSNAQLANGKGEAIASTSSAPLSHALLSKIGIPKRFTGRSIAIGFATLLFSLGAVLLAVPSEIFTFWGWMLTYEWVILLHGILLSCYLKHCYDVGRRAAHAGLCSQTAHWADPWNITIKCCVISIVGIILSPWVAAILRVQSLVGKVIVTAYIINKMVCVR